MAITVVQAMQLGLIPIVSKVGEMQFYVKHQQNGLVLLPPFEDLDDIINQITELVTKIEQTTVESNTQPIVKDTSGESINQPSTAMNKEKY